MSPDIGSVTKHPTLDNLIRRTDRVSYIASRLSKQQHQRNNRLDPHYTVHEHMCCYQLKQRVRTERELAEADDDTTTVSSGTSSNAASVRRHLPFQTNLNRGSSSPSSCISTPI